MRINAINSINFESSKRNRNVKREQIKSELSNSYDETDLNMQPGAQNHIKIDKNLRKYYNNPEGNFQFKHESPIKKGLRNAAATAMIAGGGLGTMAVLPSCHDSDVDILMQNQHTDNIYLDYYPFNPKKDTIYITRPDTIYTEKYDTITNNVIDTLYLDRLDTIFIPKNLNPPAGDSIRNHLDSLDTDIDGDGNIPLAILLYDEYNQTAHKLLLDADATSNSQIVMVDERRDYSDTDSENPDPQVSYVRVRFSVSPESGSEGLYVQYDKLRPGVDPNKGHFEEIEWIPKGSALQTLNGNKVTIKTFDENDQLIKYGEYLKGDKKSSLYFDMLLGNTDPVETLRRRYTQVSSQWVSAKEEDNYDNFVVRREAPIEE